MSSLKLHFKLCFLFFAVCFIFLSKHEIVHKTATALIKGVTRGTNRTITFSKY